MVPAIVRSWPPVVLLLVMLNEFAPVFAVSKTMFALKVSLLVTVLLTVIAPEAAKVNDWLPTAPLPMV
jgi:hypothetical protein